MTDPDLKKADEINPSHVERAKFLPWGLVQVALILSPYNLIANALAGVYQFDGSTLLISHYAVAFIQSLFIYGITFSVQNRKSRTSPPKGGAHLRSLIISAIVITLLTYGNWYGRS